MSIIGDGLEILGLIDKAKNAEVYRQLGDYIEKIRTQQIENDRLHSDVRDLQEKLRFKGIIERVGGHTFLQGDQEEICPRCAVVDSRPNHLIQLGNRGGQYSACCPQCKLETLDRYPLKREEASKL